MFGISKSDVNVYINVKWILYIIKTQNDNKIDKKLRQKQHFITTQETIYFPHYIVQYHHYATECTIS